MRKWGRDRKGVGRRATKRKREGLGKGKGREQLEGRV